MPHITVLHVEDDSDFADLSKTFLERDHGIEVLTENSASRGLERLEKNGDIDCIVSDYQMPGMDGMAVLNRCKAWGFTVLRSG